MKMNFRTYTSIALAACCLHQLVLANPISESSIPENVDWFAHLDADQFRMSRVGGKLFSELSNIDPLKENQKLPVNPVLVLNGLRGITAFGTIPNAEAMNGGDVDVVAIISGTPELMQIFKALISGIQLEQPEAVAEIKEGDHTIISMVQAGVSGVFLGEDQVAISKSMDSMSKFLAVRTGKATHLQFGKRFPAPDYIDGMGVYLGVYVEGLGDMKEMPAQARILQMTQAVAVQLGESQDNMHLLASLLTDLPETAMKVKDVLNGLIAVMVLTQNGDTDFASLVDSANVTQEANAVTLRLDYPAASAEKWVSVLVEKIKADMKAKNESGANEDESGLAGGADPIEPIKESEPVG